MRLRERFEKVLPNARRGTVQKLLEAVCAEIGHDRLAEPITGTSDKRYIRGTGPAACAVLRAIGPCRRCKREAT